MSDTRLADSNPKTYKPSEVFPKLAEAGHVLSNDLISREMIEDGTIARRIENGIIASGTSNPDSYLKVVKDCAEGIKAFIAQNPGAGPEAVHDRFIVDRVIVPAVKLFRPVNEKTNFRHGYMSVEFRPRFTPAPFESEAPDDAWQQIETASEKKESLKTFLSDRIRLNNAGSWKLEVDEAVREAMRIADYVRDQAGSKNVYVKIPATATGIVSGAILIGNGYNINFTLVASRRQYRATVWAHQEGVREFVGQGGDPKRGPAGDSVSSVFVSRDDRVMDKILKEKGAGHLSGRTGLAYSKAVIYPIFEAAYMKNPVWKAFSEKTGARLQQIYWASTGVKDQNGKYTSDPKYVGGLKSPGTTDTAPPDVIDLLEQDVPFDWRMTIWDRLDEERRALDEIRKLGIDLESVKEDIHRDGLHAFAASDVKEFAFINELRA